MQLILAIDSDPRRSEQLASLVRARLHADLVQATSAGEGLLALRDRVPDLILTPPLLSPFDDGVLDEYLRDLGAAGAHVQTVRIPVLNPEPKRRAFTERLFVLGLNRQPTSSSASPDGCDPTVFADEIAAYLSRAASARQTVAHLAQALARQDEAMSRAQQDPVPSKPAAAPRPAAEWNVINDEVIADFTDAIDRRDRDVVEPRYNTLTDSPDTAAVQQVQEIVSEPTYVEPTYVEPTYVEPAYVEPAYVEPTYIKPAVSADADQLRYSAEPIVDPKWNREPLMPAEPLPTARDKSATFEAALAAIRAAWIKPDGTTSAPPAQRDVNASSESRDDTHAKSVTSRVISIR